MLLPPRKATRTRRVIVAATLLSLAAALSTAWAQPPARVLPPPQGDQPAIVPATAPVPPIAPAAPASPPKFQAPITPTRADLARVFLQLEHALSIARDKTPRQRAENSKAFDALTMTFFSGRYGDVIKQLHAFIDKVGVASPDSDRQLARSLRVSCDPQVIALDAFATAKVTLTSMYDAGAGAGLAAPVKRPITVRFTRSGGGHTASLWTEATIEPAGMISAELLIDLPKSFAGAAPGVYDVSVDFQTKTSAAPVDIGRIVIASRAPSADRALITERAQALEAANEQERPVLATAARRVLGRASLLTDTPSPNNSSEFMLDIPRLVIDLNAELDQIAAGTDPFKSRAGDWWVLLSTGQSTLPARIIAPPTALAPPALTPGPKAPLLIALHGLGGDENMFPDAYGNGKLASLAAQRGFILVSPRVDLMTFASPKALDALLDDLATMYDFDRERVYVLGHSMGAGAGAFAARNSITKVAGVACLAGGLQRPVARPVAPILIYAGELDPIASAKTLKAAALASKAAGFRVEYREAANEGHTLMVASVLDDAVAWLLEQRLDPQERQRWLDADKARPRKAPGPNPAGAPAVPAPTPAAP